jgi:tumor protein p53-inducible protein 3
VVLDPVAGAYADQNLQVLGMDGRWVLYSSLSGPAMGEDLSKTFLKALMLKRVSLLATTLRARPLAYKAELVRRFSTEVLPRLGRPGGLRLIIDREVEGLDAAQGAHEYMESNANMGKIVLHVSAGGQR